MSNTQIKNPLASLSEISCPENDQVKCRRFSTHGAVCVPVNQRFEPGDSQQLDWELNTIKKDTDKCFSFGSGDGHLFVANNAADVAYVLHNEIRNIYSKASDLSTLSKNAHNSPYCSFTFNSIPIKHYLYSNMGSVEFPTQGYDSIPTVTVQASGADLECCINDVCTVGSTEVKNVDLSKSEYYYDNSPTVSFHSTLIGGK